jgi:hypothetical protein
MSKYVILVLIILEGLFAGCSNPSVAEQNSDQSSDTTWITVTPKNYLDFEYSKVIAYATVDPMDNTALYSSGRIDSSQVLDTISVTLDNSQIDYLNQLLSGRHRKPYPKGTSEKLVADCFYPRHNIIFLDRQDSVINYITVCFECGRIRKSKPDLAVMDNMYTFFNSIGLTVFDRPDYHARFYDSLSKSRKQSVIHDSPK